MKNPILSFLTDYLSDIHIKSVLTNDKNICLSDLDLGLRESIIKEPPKNTSHLLNRIADHTLYHITDAYRCSYTFFSVQDDPASLFFIGPYTLCHFTDTDIHQIMEQLSIPSKLQPQLSQYYYSIPYIPQKSYFHQLLLCSYSHISGCDNPGEQMIDLSVLESRADFEKQHIYEVSEDPVLSMKLLESRYQLEDELLDAISHGNTSRALACVEINDNIHISQRSADPLQNAQSLAITLNTLLRRTAYEAGVHPFYIDSVSTNFARMITASNSIAEIRSSYSYMVRSYCSLVNKHNLSAYSKPIRHILVLVDASLDSDLSLKRFADELFLSTSYLSTLFKKEVGLTLTDYVNKCRITAAKKLLRSTLLPTQQIAISCGIPDIHYFTRLFRRETGMTPKAWRNQSAVLPD